jgi:hypothetical protein
VESEDLLIIAFVEPQHMRSGQSLTLGTDQNRLLLFTQSLLSLEFTDLDGDGEEVRAALFPTSHEVDIAVYLIGFLQAIACP